MVWNSKGVSPQIDKDGTSKCFASLLIRDLDLYYTIFINSIWLNGDINIKGVACSYEPTECFRDFNLIIWFYGPVFQQHQEAVFT